VTLNHGKAQRAWLGGKATQMATNRKEINQEEPNPPWLAFAKFLFIAFLTIMAFLLVRSMVHNHFFSGGQLNRHDTAPP
jgi:hypothetical protein